MSAIRGVAVLAVLAGGAVTVQAHAVETRASATTVRIVMKEWSMPPTPARVKAGTVTFVVRNAGKLEHEFVILRTNRPANALPVRGGRAVETGRVARLPHIRRGQTKRLTVTLRAGRYVLLCNLPAHYKAGQRAAFRVT